MGISLFITRRKAAISRMASRECPPSSKKLSCMPTRSPSSISHLPRYHIRAPSPFPLPQPLPPPPGFDPVPPILHLPHSPPQNLDRPILPPTAPVARPVQPALPKGIIDEPLRRQLRLLPVAPGHLYASNADLSWHPNGCYPAHPVHDIHLYIAHQPADRQ